MSMDMVANFCTSIRNAVAVRRRVLEVPHSKLKENVAAVMKKAGYLKDFQVESLDNVKKIIKIFPQYVNGHPAITEIKSVSTSGSRVYSSVEDMRPIKGGFGISIVSTNKGVMSDKAARKIEFGGKKNGVGGEVLCTIW